MKLKLRSSQLFTSYIQPGVWIWIICQIFLFQSSHGRGLQEITCGSVFKLLNTAFKIRLHSHDVKYGSGSGQQSVTGTDVKEDVNSNWQVKGIPNLPCTRGEPVKCGTKIRLEHIQTGRNLHSHLFSSPLSGHQEISAFGEEGEGDSGDIWEIVCKSHNWQRDDAIQLRHVDTEAYLSASGNTYGRPIHGQMEIIGISHSDSSCYWKAVEGIFVHPSEPTPTRSHSDSEHEHNEL
ncbi:Stromal cell-derived factor 2 [Orchesella cincta]|uniref:Stromal cell-derived factor 2 n=1 Tax=Orchesella cincta TaxID=48709 RepID=A0A1D2MUV7_ORCCI|nr:Stromal cell-derived factor 2 [Orchesella cincta]